MTPALSARRILGLPVETRSGQHLGKVQDFAVDPTTQVVLRYTVRSSSLLGELFPKALLVDASQVISLTETLMTVDDLIIKNTETAVVPSPVAPSGT